MDFAHPHFAEPKWLWLAILGPLLMAALYRYAAWSRRLQIAKLVVPERAASMTRSHSPIRRLSKQLLLQISVACIGLTLARPQWGEQTEAIRTLGEDILFLLDVSKSMLSSDVKPNRLTRAKFSIMDFVQRHGQGRVGLLVFAGQAFLQCPLTFDYDAFQESLMAVDAQTIPVPGTDLGRALEEAFAAMEKNERRKVMVLGSDGEDLENKGVSQAKELADKGVMVFTIGVGTPAGSTVPQLSPQGTADVLRDSTGNVVTSRLDENTLRNIAEATKGTYRPLGTVGEGMMQVRKLVEASADAANLAPRRKLGIDRFHVPLTVLTILLVVESLVGERRRQWRPKPQTTPEPHVYAEKVS